MRALRFFGEGDVHLEEAAEPGDDLGSNELLVAPRLCGICGTDLHEYRAGPIVVPVEPHPLTGAKVPQTLGHEFSAEVVAVGSAVSNARIGDRVSIMPLIFCGHCYFCRRGMNHLCEVMGCTGLSSPWGGMSDLAIVADYQVAVLPEELSLEQGALIEPFAVAAFGVERGGVEPGDRVLITGAGPIGSLAIMAAVAAGAAAVYVSEPNSERAALARSAGAAEVFDPTQSNVEAEVRERTSGLGVDVSIECVGNEAALDACVTSTRRAGTVVQTGLHVGPASVDPMAWALNELTIQGTWCYRVYQWPKLVGQLVSGSLPIEKIVTARVPLEDAVTLGFDALLSQNSPQVKVLVDLDP